MIEPSASGRLFGILAKYWQPGQVKTRLARRLGETVAAQVHHELFSTLLRRFHLVAADRVIGFTPADRRREFAEMAGDDWNLVAQTDGDLGQRMAGFFADALRAGYQRIVLIGSDSPTIPTATIDRAFELLASHDVVIGPSDDGGYYLLGVARKLPPIFTGIAWSTSHVFRQTLAAAHAAQLSVGQLPPWYDIDEFADLVRLAEELATTSDESLKPLREFVARLVK